MSEGHAVCANYLCVLIISRMEKPIYRIHNSPLLHRVSYLGCAQHLQLLLKVNGDFVQSKQTSAANSYCKSWKYFFSVPRHFRAVPCTAGEINLFLPFSFISMVIKDISMIRIIRVTCQFMLHHLQLIQNVLRYVN